MSVGEAAARERSRDLVQCDTLDHEGSVAENRERLLRLVQEGLGSYELRFVHARAVVPWKRHRFFHP